MCKRNLKYETALARVGLLNQRSRSLHGGKSNVTTVLVFSYFFLISLFLSHFPFFISLTRNSSETLCSYVEQEIMRKKLEVPALCRKISHVRKDQIRSY